MGESPETARAGLGTLSSGICVTPSAPPGATNATNAMASPTADERSLQAAQALRAGLGWMERASAALGRIEELLAALATEFPGGRERREARAASTQATEISASLVARTHAAIDAQLASLEASAVLELVRSAEVGNEAGEAFLEDLQTVTLPVARCGVLGLDPKSAHAAEHVQTLCADDRATVASAVHELDALRERMRTALRRWEIGRANVASVRFAGLGNGT